MVIEFHTIKRRNSRERKSKNVQPYFLIVEIACIIGGILLALILVKLLDFIKKTKRVINFMSKNNKLSLIFHF